MIRRDWPEPSKVVPLDEGERKILVKKVSSSVGEALNKIDQGLTLDNLQDATHLLHQACKSLAYLEDLDLCCLMEPQRRHHL